MVLIFKTIEDIVKCLKQPNIDFRDDFENEYLKVIF